MEFPHQSLVSFIRDTLWRRKGGTTTGRAAVMVGAGFSRNANPASSSARPFPTWPDLTRKLFARLHPPGDGTLSGRASANPVDTSGALRLAQEFEAVFGRFQLDDFIRSSVPDEDHQPGEMHSRLLALPWADVFTTNWDTLLERGQADVFERAYDVVRTPSQIPSTALPRIVKLHGSMPAHQPFIFTEEDYRTYPTRFAPFVNLVQQAMMENTFVLVGFSGDDPNFLHWSGWVRDNLGAQAPKIYLVGWLALSPHRRRMLEDSNVVPVDLSELPQARTWPEAHRHRWATEWFLSALEEGRPIRASSWPNLRTQRTSYPPYLLPVPASQISVRVLEPLPGFASQHPLPKPGEQLSQATTAWATNRASYPGWLVAPPTVRDAVWLNVENWLGREFKEGLADLAPRRRLIVLSELVWRLDVTLIGSRVDESVGLAIEALLGMVEVETRSLKVPDAASQPLDWREWWAVATITSEMVRLSRYQGSRENFERWLIYLGEVTAGDTDAAHAIRYERCLWSLQMLDHPGTERLLDTWIVEKADPIWAVRKAGLLAGIARVDDARAVFRLALARIRRERHRDEDDHGSMTRETWALWLALALDWHDWGQEDTATSRAADPFERWREFRQHDLDAFADYNSIVAELQNAENDRPSEENTAPAFDLDRVNRTRFFRSGLPPKVRAGLTLLRLSEITGLPAAANRVSLLAEGLRKSVSVLADHEPWFCALLAMRLAQSGSDKVLDGFFSRSRVALLDAEQVQRLRQMAQAELQHALPRCRAPEDRAAYWHGRLTTSVEMLSRLTLRLQPTEVAESFSTAMELYRQEWPVGDREVAQALERLFSRSIESLPPDALAGILPALVALPIPGTPDFLHQGQIGNLRDPLLFVPLPEPGARAGLPGVDDGALRAAVNRLLELSKASSSGRRSAIFRLHQLHEWGLLQDGEAASFAELLWGPDNLRRGNLPGGHDLLPWVALRWPEVVKGQAAEGFRRAFLLSPDRMIADVSGFLMNVGMAIWRTRKAEEPFSPSQEEMEIVFAAIQAWVARTSEQPNDPFSRDSNEARNAILGLAALLMTCSPPGYLVQAVWDKVERLEKTGDGSCFVLFPAFALAFPDRVGSLAQRLRRGLVDDDPEFAGQAAVSISRWLLATSDGLPIPPLADDLVSEIGTAIASRRKGALLTGLDFAKWLFTDGPADRRTLIVDGCEHGLAYLLAEADYRSQTGQKLAAEIDVPLLRRNCVQLALAMQRAGYGGDAVRSWLEAARSDPLPEVRNVVAYG